MKDSKDQIIKRSGEILKLIESSKNAVLTSIDEEGFPNARMMFARVHEGVRTHYFTTNVSSHHTNQLIANPKACVYYFNTIYYKGLTLMGTVEVCNDFKTREKLWQPGDERYYPNGIEDEDYCVLKFTVERGRYYYGMGGFTFTLDELEEVINKQNNLNQRIL